MIKRYLLLILVLSCIFSYAMAEDYTDGFKNAYNYAFEKGVTTMNSISKANMYGSITRIEMAKMISEFSINVLWLKLDKTKDCNFYDTSPDLDAQYNNWVTKVCQLWLMWIYDDWTKSDYFNPKKTVTRWEWATILSRAIRLSEWSNVIKNGNPFYEPHINYLLLRWIVNSYDNPSPKSEEKRWNVMLMLYKADKRNTIITNKSTWSVSLKAWQIYRNEYFGIQITSDWKRPRLVSIDELYDEYTKSKFYGVSIYNFVEEKMGTLSLDREYYFEEFKDNAKKNNVEWLLMLMQTLYISEKWWFCDQQRDDDWYLSDFWSFVYKTNKYIIRDSGFWSYQELPYYDTSYDDIRDSLWNSYVNNVEVAIHSLIRNNLYSNLDNFYIKGNAIGIYNTLNKNEIQKYENIIKETRKEIKEINNSFGDVPTDNKSWKTVVSQRTKMSNSDTYYDSSRGFKMKHDWYFPWLIADSSAKGFSIYVFVPESIWNFELMEEKKEEFIRNAKLFGQTGYLMEVRNYYLSENKCWEFNKWTTKNWFNICTDSSSDYLVFASRFPYRSKNATSIEKARAEEYFKNWVWYFPIDVNV